jgi:hypothetical protein
VATALAAAALCAWGTVGWRRAYAAQVTAAGLARERELREAQLLRIVVRGDEAAAELSAEERAWRPRAGEACGAPGEEPLERLGEGR